MTDDADRKIENRAEAIAKKTEFELRNGFRQQDHFQFIGGFLKYHQWITLTLGTVFTSLALLHQKGSFLYFYLFGLYKITKDTIRTYLDYEEVKLSPVIFYVFSGILVIIVLTEVGFGIPDMSLGLIQNIQEATP